MMISFSSPSPVAADVAPTARKKILQIFSSPLLPPLCSSLPPTAPPALALLGSSWQQPNVSRRRRRRRGRRRWRGERRRRRRRVVASRVRVRVRGGERPGAGAVGPDPAAPLPAGASRRARRLHAPDRHRAPPQVRLPR
jgi:hypothetical protein